MPEELNPKLPLNEGQTRRMAAHVKTALGLSLTPHEFNLEVSEPSVPPAAVGVVFDVPLDLLGYLIPMALARPLVERRLSRRARYEVEKNLSRLAGARERRDSGTASAGGTGHTQRIGHAGTNARANQYQRTATA
jgi:hypothetical protein